MGWGYSLSATVRHATVFRLVFADMPQWLRLGGGGVQALLVAGARGSARGDYRYEAGGGVSAR